MSARKPFATLTGNEPQRARGRRSTKARTVYDDWAANDRGDAFWSDAVDSITPVTSNCASDRTATLNRTTTFRPRPPPPAIQVPASLKKKTKAKKSKSAATLLRRRKRFWRDGLEQANRETRLRSGSASAVRNDSSSSSSSSDEESYEMDISSDSEDESTAKPDADEGKRVPPTTVQTPTAGILPLYTPCNEKNWGSEGKQKPTPTSFDASGSLLEQAPSSKEAVTSKAAVAGGHESHGLGRLDDSFAGAHASGSLLEQAPSSKEAVTSTAAVAGGHEVHGSGRFDDSFAGAMETNLGCGPFDELPSSPNRQVVPSANDAALHLTQNVPRKLLEQSPSATTPPRDTNVANTVVAPSEDETALSLLDQSLAHVDRQALVHVKPTRLSQEKERSDAHQQHGERGLPHQGHRQTSQIQSEMDRADFLGFAEPANRLERSTSAEVVMGNIQMTLNNADLAQPSNEQTLEPTGKRVLINEENQPVTLPVKSTCARVLENVPDLQTLQCEDAFSPSHEPTTANGEAQFLPSPDKAPEAQDSTELTRIETANEIEASLAPGQPTGSTPSQTVRLVALGCPALKTNKEGERKEDQPEENAVQQTITCNSNGGVNNLKHSQPPHIAHPTPTIGSAREPRAKKPTPARPESFSSFPESPRRNFLSSRNSRANSSLLQAVIAPNDTMSQEGEYYDFVCTSKGPTFLPSLESDSLMATVPLGWTRNTTRVACYEHPDVGRVFLHPLGRYEEGRVVATAAQGTSHPIAARQTTNIDESHPTSTTRNPSPKKSPHLQAGFLAESTADSKSNNSAQKRTEKLVAHQLCSLTPATQNLTDSEKGSDSFFDCDREIRQHLDNADQPWNNDGFTQPTNNVNKLCFLKDEPSPNQHFLLRDHVDYQSPDTLAYEDSMLTHRSVDSPSDDPEFPSSDQVEDHSLSGYENFPSNRVENEGQSPSDDTEFRTSDYAEDEGDEEDSQSEHSISPAIQRHHFGTGGHSNFDSVVDDHPGDLYETDISHQNRRILQSSPASSTSSSVSRECGFLAAALDVPNSSFASPFTTPFVMTGKCDDLISPLGEDGASTICNDGDLGRSTSTQRQRSGMGGRPNSHDSQLVDRCSLDDSCDTDCSYQNCRQLQFTSPSRSSSSGSPKRHFPALALDGISNPSFSSPFVTGGNFDESISPLGEDGASILCNGGKQGRVSEGNGGRRRRTHNQPVRLCSLQFYWIPVAQAIMRQRVAKNSVTSEGDFGVRVDSIASSDKGDASKISLGSITEGGSGIIHRNRARHPRMEIKGTLENLVSPTPRIKKKPTRSVESVGVHEDVRKENHRTVTKPVAKRSLAPTATNARRRRKTS